MSAIKIKVVQTQDGTMVSIDGRAGYDTDNKAKKEARNLEHLIKYMGLDETTVEIEVHEVG